MSGAQFGAQAQFIEFTVFQRLQFFTMKQIILKYILALYRTEESLLKSLIYFVEYVFSHLNNSRSAFRLKVFFK